MTTFVHLHAHSHYSLLDGLGKTADMIKHVKEHGMDALALTDHGVLYGAIDFYQTAKASGVKPIIGFEAYMAPGKRQSKTAADRDPYHLILLAKDATGYRNLLKLVTEAHLTGYYYKPRIDWELLEECHEGLICTSACLASETSQLILKDNIAGAKAVMQRYAQLFGDDYYLELQHHPNIPEQGTVNEAVKALAKELSLPLVATNDAHYVKPTDAEAQDALLCIQTGKMLSDTDRMNMTNEDFSLKTPEEMAAPFADVPEAITNTVKIAEKCNLEIPMGTYILPKFDVPEGMGDEKQYLRRLVYQGLFRRYRASVGDVDQQPLYNADVEGAHAFLKEHGLPQEFLDRAEYELGVIERMGFPSYFLIVQDFVNWAKDHEVAVGPGRGSGAGSIVAYALRITNLDPMKFGLLFERFLNPDRISMPDFDLDFADDRRGEVIEYVADKYGRDHVAQIITFGTLGAKAAVRDTGRVMGMGYGTVDEVCKIIPSKPGTKLADVRKQSDMQAVERSDAQIKRLLDLAERLEGSNRHASTHAAGVVIADKPLVNYVPLQFATRDDAQVVTQFSMVPIEDIGLLKMDFLGLSNLTILRNATAIIEAVYGETIDVDDLPLDDPVTYQLFTDTKTYGVFQFESDGMRRYLRELKPNRFEDIVAMGALYRPGPMQWIPDFINRKHGRAAVTYLHPKMENALKETYGVMVYQEQVMQIAKDLCGFTGGQADTLRKGVAKKKADVLAKLKEDFINGAIEHSDADRGTMEQFWSSLEDFAQYCFNKSHAACYALIAYQTAWLKAHYPSAFMAALMTSEQENMDKLPNAIADAESMGIEVLPPDVNESFANFAVAPDKKNIRFGLTAIKNVGRNTVEAIITARKENGTFTSITNFLSRLPEGSANRKSLESLIKAGALDSLADRAQMLAGLEAMSRFAAMRAAEGRNGQTSLFGEETAAAPDFTLPPAGTIDTRQKLEWERELLGMYVSEHPLDSLAHLLEGYQPISDIPKLPDGKTIHVGGLVSTAKKIQTRKGDPMAFVTIEDKSGQLEVIVFPKLYNECLSMLETGKLIAVAGKVNRKDGDPKLLADKFQLLEGASKPPAPVAVGSEDIVADATPAPVAVPGDARPVMPESAAPPAEPPAAEPATAAETVAATPTAPAEELLEGDSITVELWPQTTLETLEQIKDTLHLHRGESPVYLVIPKDGDRRRLRLPDGVRVSKALVEALQQIDHRAEVVVG